MVFSLQHYNGIRSLNPDLEVVAVTKYQSVATIREALDVGVKVIAESKVQVAREKKRELGGYDFAYHMIGHLQSNKAKDAVQIFDMIQSVDSIRIAQKLHDQCRKIGKVMPILLQVNMTREAHKYGLLPEALDATIAMIKTFDALQLQGLMCMGQLGDLDASRLLYRELKELCLHYQLPECSMGMSDDWEAAVQEGATMVRIGSLLFGE